MTQVRLQIAVQRFDRPLCSARYNYSIVIARPLFLDVSQSASIATSIESRRNQLPNDERQDEECSDETDALSEAQAMALRRAIGLTHRSVKILALDHRTFADRLVIIQQWRQVGPFLVPQ